MVGGGGWGTGGRGIVTLSNMGCVVVIILMLLVVFNEVFC